MASPKHLLRSIMVYTLLSSACQGSTPQSPSFPDFTPAISKATPAVVHINVKRTDKTVPTPHVITPSATQTSLPSIGAGVIVAPEGYIVTNQHVIAKADLIEVERPGDPNKYVAQLVGQDPHTDLALLKVEAQEWPCLTFGSSDELHVGEWILAIGHPYDLHNTATHGIVTARQRFLKGPEQSSVHIKPFIQHNATTSPGSSGGALINLDGKLVGITTGAISSPQGGYTGHAVAIPATVVQHVVSDLKQYGQVQRGLIGICVSNIIIDERNPQFGVCIDTVRPQSAAEAAGIKAKDVLTAIDGHPIRQVAHFLALVVLRKPEERLQLTIVRGEEEKTFTVTLKRAG